MSYIIHNIVTEGIQGRCSSVYHNYGFVTQVPTLLRRSSHNDHTTETRRRPFSGIFERLVIMDEYRKSRVETSTVGESDRQGVRRVVSVIIALLAILLILRMIFMVLGANDSNAFVNLIYMLTGWMVAPFRSIFPDATFTGLNDAGVFEPGALIALVLVLLLGWLIQRAIAPKRHETTRVNSVNDVEHRDRRNH